MVVAPEPPPSFDDDPESAPASAPCVEPDDEPEPERVLDPAPVLELEPDPDPGPVPASGDPLLLCRGVDCDEPPPQAGTEASTTSTRTDDTERERMAGGLSPPDLDRSSGCATAGAQGGGGTAQNPAVHVLVVSQQSIAVVHFSCTCEQLDLVVFEQMSAPPSPSASQ